MTLEVWSIVLGSTLLGSLLTAFITKKTADKNQMMQYIVQERKKWRDDIRSETEKIIYSRNRDEIKKYKTFMQLRLNPIEDIEILEQLKNVIKASSQEIEREWGKYSKLIAVLLKEDWERSKREVKGGIILKTIATYILVLCGYIFVMQDLLLQYLMELSITKSKLAVLSFSLGLYLLACYYAKYLIDLFSLNKKIEKFLKNLVKRVFSFV